MVVVVVMMIVTDGLGDFDDYSDSMVMVVVMIIVTDGRGGCDDDSD